MDDSCSDRDAEHLEHHLAEAWDLPTDDPSSASSGLNPSMTPIRSDPSVWTDRPEAADRDGDQADDDISLHIDLGESSFPGASSIEARPIYPRTGEEIAGFRILRELGRGAFARVYLAEQRSLANRHVALKVATEAIGEESQLLARLQHQHIMPIHSVHVDEESGLHLMCMPYLGGANLARVLEETDGAGRGRSSIHGQGVSASLGGSLVAALDRIGHSVSGPELDGPAAPRPRPRLRRPLVPQEQGARSDPDDHRSSTLARYVERLSHWGWSVVGGDEPPDPSEARTQPARRFLSHATHIQAAVWVAARLAEGLEHAHQRGLLHRDLKPSNVLITADGTPMILDFNLSAALEPESREALGDRARLGGTLPYMSPEHLDAFHPKGSTSPDQVDERSDIYALGLILFEMLAGGPAFEDPPEELPIVQVLDRMIAERRRSAPSIRAIDSNVPPSLDSILKTCLAPEPERRYTSAGDLAEDLDRFLEDLPLKYARETSLRERYAKWTRRHPRISSSSTMAVVALALLWLVGAALGFVSRNFESAAAQLRFADFQRDFARCQLLLNIEIGPEGMEPDLLSQGLERARFALNRYEVDRLGARWVDRKDVQLLGEEQRERLIEQVSELLLLEARATVILASDRSEVEYAQALKTAIRRLNLAEQFDPDPPISLYRERGRYASFLGLGNQAELDWEIARRSRPETARDFYLLGRDALAEGRSDEAEQLLGRAIGLDPQRFWAWFAMGMCHYDQGRYDQAAADYSVCTVLEPAFAWAHANRGLALAMAGRLSEARLAYNRALELDPKLTETRLNRALTYLELGHARAALSDLEIVQQTDSAASVTVLTAMAEALSRLGRHREAEHAFAEALELQPNDPEIRLVRGFSRIERNPEAARADLKRVLELDPEQARAWVGLARLEEDDPNQALAHLNRAIEVDPSFLDAVELRALFRARLGRRSALEDVSALLRTPTPHRLYNASCALAILSESLEEPGLVDKALRLLRRAIDAGFPLETVRSDPDLEPLRRHDAYWKLVDDRASASRVVAQ